MATPTARDRETTSDSFWQVAKRRYLAVKTVEDLQQTAEASELKKSLGAVDLMALGIGALVGAGVFVVTGTAAANYAGPGVALSFVIAALAAALAALCYAELAAMIPLGGSAYTYAYASLGELMAWLIAWNLVLEYAVGNMAVASGFSDNFENILTAVGVTLPDALLAAPGAGGVFDVPAFLISVVITVLLIVGIRESVRANLLMVIFKLFILVLFVFIAFPSVRPENLTPFAPFGSSGIFTGAAIIFFAFIGFDAVSTAAEETKNPQRNLPIGIIGSLLVTTILYLAVAVSMVGSVPYTNLNVGDPLPHTLELLGQENWALLMSVGAIVATTSVLLVFQLGATRIFFNLARDGLLPKVFAKVHPKWQTPHYSTIGLGLLVGIFAALVPIDVLVELTNIGTLFAFIIVAVGVLVLRKMQPDTPRPFKVPLVPWVPLAAIAICGFLALSLPVLTLWRFVAWMGVGLMIYGAYGARRSVLRQRDVL